MLTDKLLLCQREPEGMASSPEPPADISQRRHLRRGRNDGHNGRKTAPSLRAGRGAELGFTPVFFQER